MPPLPMAVRCVPTEPGLIQMTLPRRKQHIGEVQRLHFEPRPIRHRAPPLPLLCRISMPLCPLQMARLLVTSKVLKSASPLPLTPKCLGAVILFNIEMARPTNLIAIMGLPMRPPEINLLPTHEVTLVCATFVIRTRFSIGKLTLLLPPTAHFDTFRSPDAFDAALTRWDTTGRPKRPTNKGLPSPIRTETPLLGCTWTLSGPKIRLVAFCPRLAKQVIPGAVYDFNRKVMANKDKTHSTPTPTDPHPPAPRLDRSRVTDPASSTPVRAYTNTLFKMT